MEHWTILSATRILVSVGASRRSTVVRATNVNQARGISQTASYAHVTATLTLVIRLRAFVSIAGTPRKAVIVKSKRQILIFFNAVINSSHPH